MRPVGNVLVTGGAGFVGGNFVRLVLATRPSWRVTVLDSCDGGTRPVLAGPAQAHPDRCRTVTGGITDLQELAELFDRERFDAVVHFAARNPSGLSEENPAAFVAVNVLGTATVLEAARLAWGADPGSFIHLSSYEVYGSCPEGIFREDSALRPSTPYAASKAAADELTLAYHRTFGLRAMVTRTTNIYGPFQSPDKLIPALALCVKARRPLTVFGTGGHSRDWIHVDDHNRGVIRVLEGGRAGEVYHLGARNEHTNLDLARSVARAAAGVLGMPGAEAEGLITLVEDRLAHDARRALDPSRAEGELGFRPEVPFERGLRDTVRWVLEANAPEAPRGGP
jgi:dTDP-glucose 4,6-dehydratase